MLIKPTIARSIFISEKAVCFRDIGNAHFLRVPFDFLSDPKNNVAEEDCFCERGGVIEIGACRPTTLACPDPIFVNIADTEKGRIGPLVFLVELLR